MQPKLVEQRFLEAEEILLQFYVLRSRFFQTKCFVPIGHSFKRKSFSIPGVLKYLLDKIFFFGFILSSKHLQNTWTRFLVPQRTWSHVYSLGVLLPVILLEPFFYLEVSKHSTSPVLCAKNLDTFAEPFLEPLSLFVKMINGN